jgi:spore coat protein U-like protein
MKKTKLYLLCLFGAISVQAASLTGNLEVSADVIPVCKIDDAVLNFGHYNANSNSPTMVTESIYVTCSNTVSYTVFVNSMPDVDYLTPNNISDVTVDNRLMVNLYKGSNITDNWGDAEGFGLTNIGNGFSQAIAVTGKINEHQYVTAGGYSKSYIMTVSY